MKGAYLGPSYADAEIEAYLRSALYDLIVQALRWFAEEQDPRLWVHYFELQLLSCCGYQPDFFECASCHAAIQPVINFFSLDEGGFLCARCGQSRPQAKAISVNAQKVLRFMQRHDCEAVRAWSIAETTHAEVESLLQSYMEHTLERDVKSLVFLQRLRRELRAAAKGRPDRCPVAASPSRILVKDRNRAEMRPLAHVSGGFQRWIFKMSSCA